MTRSNDLDLGRGRLQRVVRRTTVTRARAFARPILKWAFEGKLVDQDPSDEPADELLARIRAERAAAAPTKKTRGRTAKGAA